jgi:hypothetical protein
MVFGNEAVVSVTYGASVLSVYTEQSFDCLLLASWFASICMKEDVDFAMSTLFVGFILNVNRTQH